MSAQDERSALTLRPALHDHALHLLSETPAGTPRPRSLRLPPEPGADADPLPRQEAEHAVRRALDPLPDDSAALHREFARLGIRDRHSLQIRTAVAELPIPAGQREAARSLGRQLSRTGTTGPAVTAGLALLLRLGEPEDIPYLSVLGVFRAFTLLAVDALDRLDRRSAALLWLAVHARNELQPLVAALRAGEGRAVRTELLAAPASPRLLGSAVARRIAEAARLTDLLDRHPADPDLLARAALLLARMGCSHDDPADLLAHREAPHLYETVVVRAGLLPPTPDHAAVLLTLALDLSSGIGALLDLPPGRRAALLESLDRLLAEPRWSAPAAACPADPEQRRRADWFRRTRRQPFGLPAAPSGLRIEVVAGDPADRQPVETRILVDGRPLVPAVFGRGPAHSPEYLLDTGRLRAGPEPREVQLAEAWCTEGCCGTLRVTVRRDGDQVVWENWRRPESMPGSREPAPELPAHRFDAAAYDAEVARAEADRSWSWPARTTVRLITAGLAADPDLLGRWDAAPGWTGTGFEDPDTVVVTFRYEPRPADRAPERPGNPLYFSWVLPDDGTPPQAQAAAALRRLAAEDPKTYSRVSGGSRERAEELGYRWDGAS